jgi:hypothetical protein
MATEKRLIDANALMDAFRSHMVENYNRNKCTLEENCETCEPGCLWRKKVNEAPTVDAVEVVRCKDCKHRGEEGGCPMYFVDEIEWDDDGYIEADYVPHDYTVDDGFCDRGERRTDNV